jgi:hypothetical protein
MTYNLDIYNGFYWLISTSIKVGKMKSFFEKLVKMGQYGGTPIFDRLFITLAKNF